jgi:hypothetical protein
MRLAFNGLRQLLAVGWLVFACCAQATDLPKFTWTVRAGTAIAIEPGEAIPLAVIVGSAVSASNVHVVQSTLVDKATLRLPSKHPLTLCATASASPCKQLDLAAGFSGELQLLGASRVGQFEGTVTLASNEKPEGDTVQLSVGVSTLAHKLWGVATIALGVALAWFGTVYVRNAISRDLLLSPVVAARATLRGIQVQVKNGKPPAVSVEALCERIESELRNIELGNNGLPPVFPLFVATTATSLADFKAYTQKRLDWIAAIGLVVREGLQEVWRTAPGPGAPLTPAGAVKKLGDLLSVPTAPPLDQLHAAVAAIVVQLQPAGGVPGLVGSRANASPQTSVELQAHVTRLSAAGWFFMLAVTALAGSYILIFGPGNAGFGTVPDYIKCVLWGLGLPAGTQLMQATTGSIATSWGVPR